MSQKPISRKPFLDLATLPIPYVTITPAYRCHGKVNYVFKRHLQSFKISKTKRRNTFNYTGLVVKLFFDATLLMTDIIRRSSITDRVTNLATLSHQISHCKTICWATCPKFFHNTDQFLELWG